MLLLDGAVVLRVADGADEVSDTLRGVASPAHTDEGGHTRIIPAVYETALHKLQELPLTHHRVSEIEPIKLILARAVVAVLRLEEVDEIVVKGAVGDKLERTDRVGHSLEVVTLSMRKVIHRIDRPVRPGASVRLLDDAVDDRVAEEEIGVRHVDLRPEGHRPLGVLAVAHFLK